MNLPSQNPRVQYAVIETRRSQGRAERFVIAYRTERSLREYIAAPRIVASGFDSRAAAMISLTTPELVESVAS
jgi:hypothetical protein